MIEMLDVCVSANNSFRYWGRKGYCENIRYYDYRSNAYVESSFCKNDRMMNSFN